MLTRPDGQTESKAFVATGDAGLLIKADGSIQVFNTFDLSDPNKITEQQMETHNKLEALALALRIPKIMSIIEAMANDRDIQAIANEQASD